MRAPNFIIVSTMGTGATRAALRSRLDKFIVTPIQRTRRTGCGVRSYDLLACGRRAHAPSRGKNSRPHFFPISITRGISCCSGDARRCPRKILRTCRYQSEHKLAGLLTDVTITERVSGSKAFSEAVGIDSQARPMGSAATSPRIYRVASQRVPLLLVPCSNSWTRESSTSGLNGLCRNESANSSGM